MRRLLWGYLDFCAETGIISFRLRHDAAAVRDDVNIFAFDINISHDIFHAVIFSDAHIVDNSGIQLIARKAMKECYKAYERSLRYWPDNTMVLNNYAYFLSLEERDLERALTMSSRVVALTDNNPTYLDTHGWVLFKLGRTDEARKILQKAVALDGQKSPELMVHYGDILHLLGEQFMAEIYWRRALEKGYDARQIEQRLKQPAVKKPEPKE